LVNGRLAQTSDTGFTKLTTRQIGGRLQTSNRILPACLFKDPFAIGCAMNCREAMPLSIGAIEHQPPAPILPLEHAYNVSRYEKMSVSTGRKSPYVRK